MVLLADVVHRILQHEELYSHVTFRQLAAFLEIISRLLPLLDLVSPRRRVTLPSLPPNVAHVLSMGTDLPPSRISELWIALGPTLLEGVDMTVSQADVDFTLSTIGPSQRLGQFCSCVIQP